LINRLIVISTLILASSLAVNWILDDSQSPELEAAQNDPDLYMLNASINQFSTEGVLTHTLSAARFTHFPLTDLTTLKSPRIELGSENTANPWRIAASEGRLLSASLYREEIVELWNNVLANQSSDSREFVQIQTNSLTVYPEREYAETDEKVYIDNQTGRTTAAGMKAFLDTGKFQFFSDGEERVITIFLPEA
jgi:lipopolysaccharide export system protein LptC